MTHLERARAWLEAQEIEDRSIQPHNGPTHALAQILAEVAREARGEALAALLAAPCCHKGDDKAHCGDGTIGGCRACTCGCIGATVERLAKEPNHG